jgi:hypothetical protein
VKHGVAIKSPTLFVAGIILLIPAFAILSNPEYFAERGIVNEYCSTTSAITPGGELTICRVDAVHVQPSKGSEMTISINRVSNDMEIVVEVNGETLTVCKVSGRASYNIDINRSGIYEIKIINQGQGVAYYDLEVNATIIREDYSTGVFLGLIVGATGTMLIIASAILASLQARRASHQTKIPYLN